MIIWRVARPGEKAHIWVPSYDHPHFDEPLCDKAQPVGHAALVVVAHQFDEATCCAECHRLSDGSSDP